MPPYTLPELPYGTDALEPHLSARILELHHGRHHRAYVDGANTAPGARPVILPCPELQGA